MITSPKLMMVMTRSTNTASYIKDLDGLYRAVIRNEYNQVIFDQPSFPSLYHAMKHVQSLQLDHELN
jgi:hypothetical protein